MTIDGIKVADWAAAECRKKSRAERRLHFFVHVRGIFLLLLLAAILVFLQDHQLEIQRFSSATLVQLTKSRTADSIRENALKHEREVDQINQ